MPGVSYVKSINGEVIRPEYYPNLSREKIIKSFNNYLLNKNIETNKTVDSILLGDLSHFDGNILTKGETLRRFTPLLKKSNIEKLFIFTTEQWKKNSESIMDSIRNQLDDQKVI